MRKNDVKMIDPKIIQNHSQEVPGPSGHQKTLKNNVEHPPETLRDVLEKWQKIGSNPSFAWLFRPKIIIFAMLTHVLPCGSLSGEARGLSEKIFPNIEDGRVFWVKRTFERPFIAGKWKMRFLKPNTFRTPPDRFEYPFAYLNQGATTQNGCATPSEHLQKVYCLQMLHIILCYIIITLYYLY